MTGAGLAKSGWRAEDLLGRTPAEVFGERPGHEDHRGVSGGAGRRAPRAATPRHHQRPGAHLAHQVRPRAQPAGRGGLRRWRSPTTSPTRCALSTGSSCCSTRLRSGSPSTARRDVGCRSTSRCARWSATGQRSSLPAASRPSPIPTTRPSARSWSGGGCVRRDHLLRAGKTLRHRDGHPVWVHLTTSMVSAMADGTARYIVAENPRHHRTATHRAGAAGQRGTLPAHRRTGARGHLDRWTRTRRPPSSTLEWPS